MIYPILLGVRQNFPYGLHDSQILHLIYKELRVTAYQLKVTEEEERHFLDCCSNQGPDLNALVNFNVCNQMLAYAS